MATVTQFEDLPLPAQDIWDVIGDFGDIKKWASIIKEQSVEETPEGLVRTLVIGDVTVREARIADSQFSYTYSILDRAPMNDHRSTVAVIPLDPTTSRLMLTLSVSPYGDQTEEGLVERHTKALSGNLRAMKKAVGL
ncbi:MAG: hypothetical protein JWN61_2 [Pseudonocardiales bacterium]|nr:hypothetical protein [Pseudonocardiales bacterium]